MRSRWTGRSANTTASVATRHPTRRRGGPRLAGPSSTQASGAVADTAAWCAHTGGVGQLGVGSCSPDWGSSAMSDQISTQKSAERLVCVLHCYALAERIDVNWPKKE